MKVTVVNVEAMSGVYVTLLMDHMGQDVYVTGSVDDGNIFPAPNGYAHDAGDDDYWTQLPSATAALVMGY